MNDPLIRVLHLEDNPHDRKLVSVTLDKDGGFALTQAAGRTEFEAHLAKGQFDLVITDFNILGFDGLQALEAVQANTPHTPVVIVTGTGSEEIAVEAMKRGAADYVIKTLQHIQRLPQTLRNVLEKHHLDQAHQQGQIDLLRKNAELALLHSLNQAVNRGDELAQILTTLSTECKRIFDCFGMTIYLLSADRQALVMQFPGLPADQVARIEKLIRRPIPAVRIPRREGSWYWEVLESGQAALTHDPAAIQSMMAELTESQALKKLIPRIVRTLGLSSVITAPLTANGESIGLIDSSRREPFSQADLRWLERIACEVTTILLRHRLETELAASEDRYRDLVENSRDLICLHDLQGKILMINPWAAEALGYDINEVIGENLSEFVAPEVRDNFRDYLAEIKQKGKAKGLLYILTKSGERRIWKFNNSLRTEGVPEPVVRGMAHDITERVQAETALCDSEERYRQHFENISDGIFSIGRDLKILDASPSIEKLSGFKPEELIGKLIIDMNVLPADFMEAGLADIKKIFNGETLPTSEYELTGKDGGKKWAEISAAPQARDGELVSIVCVARDITERVQAQVALRKSEEQYRGLFERVPVGLYRTTPEGQILDANPIMVQMLGYPDQETLLAINAAELFACPDDRGKELDLLGDEEIMSSFEMLLRRRDGGVIWVRDTFRAIRDARGQILSFEGSLEDISERVRAEKTLERRAAHLQTLNTITRAAIHQSDIDQLLALTLAATLEAFELKSGAIWVRERHAIQGLPPEFIADASRSILEFGPDLMQVDAVPDWNQAEGALAATAPLMSQLGIQASLSAPIFSRLGRIGGLAVASAAPRQWTDEEIALIEAIGQQVGGAAYTAELYRQARDLGSYLQSLNNAIARASLGLDVEVITATVTNALVDECGLAFARLWLVDESGEQLVLRASAGLYTRLDGERARLSIADYPHKLGLIARSKEPLLTNLVQQDGYFDKQWASEQGLVAFAGLPILKGDQLLGVLAIFHSAELGPEVIDMMGAIVNQVTSALQNAQLFAETRWKERHLSALHEIDLAISTSLEPEQVYTTIVENTSQLFNCDISNLFRWDENSQEYIGLASHGAESGDVSGQRFPLKSSLVASEILQTRAPVVIPDAREHPLVPPHWRDRYGIQAVLAVPLLYRESVTGFLFMLMTDAPRVWTEAEVSLAESLAGQAAIAIDNARLYEQTQHHLAELSALFEVSGALRGAETVEAMLPMIVAQSMRVFEADTGALFTWNATQERFYAQSAVGVLECLIGEQVGAEESICGHTKNIGQPYIFAEMAADPYIGSRLRPMVAGVQSGICTPMLIGSTLVGTLLIGRVKPQPFSEKDAHLLFLIADMAANAIQRASLHEETHKRLRQLAALNAIGAAITASMDLDLTLNLFLKQAREQLDVDAATVFLFNPLLMTLEFAGGEGMRAFTIHRGTTLRVGESLAGEVAVSRKTRLIPNLAKISHVADLTAMITAEGFVAYAGVPLLTRGKLMGVFEVFCRKPLDPDPAWGGFLESLANQAAIAIDNTKLFGELQKSHTDLSLAYDTTLEGWSNALELRDQETEGHSQRVTAMTLKLAKAMGMHGEELAHMRRGTLLHDIGKMGIPDGTLLKAGPLSDEEWSLMRQHPVYAYNLLNKIPFLKPALDIPYSHHEKWDGTGYPKGLKGKRIPLAARIFAIVDVWDALSSERPYRQAWPQEKVLAYLQEQAGQHFDPQVVEAFLKIV